MCQELYLYRSSCCVQIWNAVTPEEFLFGLWFWGLGIREGLNWSSSLIHMAIARVARAGLSLPRRLPHTRLDAPGPLSHCTTSCSPWHLHVSWASHSMVFSPVLRGYWFPGLTHCHFCCFLLVKVITCPNSREWRNRFPSLNGRVASSHCSRVGWEILWPSSEKTVWYNINFLGRGKIITAFYSG